MFFIQNSYLMLRPISDVQTRYPSSSNADRPSSYIYWERHAYRRLHHSILWANQTGQ